MKLWKKRLELQNFQQLCSMTSTYPGKMCVYFFRSSRSHVFFKMGFLKNFANLTGKHLSSSLLLIKLHAWSPADLLKRDSNTCVFQWKMLTFLKTPFLQNTSGSCFYFLSCSYWSIKKGTLFVWKWYFLLCLVVVLFVVNKDPDKVYCKQLRSYDSTNRKKIVHPNKWTLINKHLLCANSM